MIMEGFTEELGQIFTGLCSRYMEKNSSSVSYEEAEMLMDAIAYTITAGDSAEGAVLAGGGERVLYNRGQDVLEEEMKEAKRLFQEIAADFDSYDCDNYRDTILKGIPAFFTTYRMDYAPMENVITFDYPLMEDTIVNSAVRISGVLRVRYYLQHIRYEQQLLKLFPREVVIEILGKTMKNYQRYFFDNICYTIFRWVTRQAGPDSADLLLEQMAAKVSGQVPPEYLTQMKSEFLTGF